MKKKTKIILIVVGVVLLIVLAAVFGGGPGKGVSVEIDKVEKRTIIETVSASGKIQPETEVKITSEVSGQIISLPVKEGDLVEKGDLLLQINPDLYESQLNRAVAALNTAKANLANARARKAQVDAQYVTAELTYARSKKLHEQGAISQAEWENAVSTFETAVAEVTATDESIHASEFAVKSAEATATESRDNLKRTTILAPQSGTVTALTKELGESVLGNQMMAGEVIMKISDLDLMEVDVEVNESDIVRVSLGDTATVEVDAYQEEAFKGIVTEISNTALNALGTSLSMDQVTNFSVKIRILKTSYAQLVDDHNSSPFRPGMSATVEIATEVARDVLAVPIKAVTTRVDTSSSARRFGKDKPEIDEDQEPFQVVFVRNGNKAEIRVLETGIQDTKYKEIKKGVSEGEEVISGPYAEVSKNLRNGKEIQVGKEESKEDKH
ncbi:MAG: efflux RND transporter periplasmic adaptor subunit [Flavobacteriales bacterium]|nr:efflux RND transporter periplasmic adaptor subunit [Flavobacteriales bacterium]